MADAVVQVAPDSTGKMVDNSSLTVGSNTVYRQRLNIADPTTAAGLAVVLNTTPSGSEYGLAVRLTGPLPAGTNTLGLVKLTDTNGTLTALFRPDGEIRVAADPSSLLLDTFETLNTADTWTTGTSGTGGSVVSVASGALSVTAGNAASSWAAIMSKAAFTNGATAYTNYTSAWVFDAGTVSGVKRVWGLGVVTTPTTTAPITNGVVFELDTDGATLIGAAYSNGVRTQTTTAFTKPTDGGPHRYNIFFRASRVFFEMDSQIVAVLSYPNPQIDALSAVAVAVNSSTGFPGTSGVLVAAVVGVADTGRNNQQISDGTFAWRKATVKPAATNPVASDTALVTTQHPSGLATISTGNSSTTNLGVSASFIGTTEEVTTFSQATISIFANQASATDGLSIQQSVDGTNWDFFDVYSIPISTGKTFTIPIQARYIRVVYTNGAVAQTAFRLQTIYSVGARRGSSVRPQDGRANDDDMEEVVSYLAAFNGTSWDRVRIKSASTAAVAADPAIVTTPSPNGVQFIQGFQPTASTGTITTATSVVGPVATQGINIITVAIYGTFVGVSCIFEGSADNTNWFTMQGSRIDNGLVSTGLTLASSANTAWDIPCGAWLYFRVRATAWTSGTASIVVAGQSMPYEPAPSAITQGVIQPGVLLPTGPAVAPVVIGGVGRLTNPTAVTDGSASTALFDKLGKQVVVGAIRDLKARQQTRISAPTVETTIVTAGATGVFNDVYGLIITNNGAAVMQVTIKDITAGTTVMVFEVPAQDTRGMMIPVDSALPQATAASAWTATCTPNATSVDITAMFVKNI